MRPLRRGSHQGQGAPGAYGSHRAGRSLQPHLVFQGHSLPDGSDSGHLPQGAGEGSVLRRLYRHRPRRRASDAEPGAHREGIPGHAGKVRGRLQGRHGRGGRQGAAGADRPGSAEPSAPGGAENRLFPEEAADCQAAGGRGGLPGIRQQAQLDDYGRAARYPSRHPSHDSAGRRPVRHL